VYREKGEEKKMKDFLPADKQFLSTKGVSCVRRVAEIMTNETDFDVEVEGEEEEHWFTTKEAVPAAEEGTLLHTYFSFFTITILHSVTFQCRCDSVFTTMQRSRICLRMRVRSARQRRRKK